VGKVYAGRKAGGGGIRSGKGLGGRNWLLKEKLRKRRKGVVSLKGGGTAAGGDRGRLGGAGGREMREQKC